MPQSLTDQEPTLKQYDFVKLENDLLVVDPMETTVVAVIPLKFRRSRHQTKKASAIGWRVAPG
jgi:hypothetical protein